MRTSHREIRRRIEEEKSRVTDEEFFSSREYQAYLSDITEAATKRYQRPIRVTVAADHDSGVLAYTDFSGIYINACNPVTWSMPSRRLRSLSIEGLIAHENGHNLFTDNRVWRMFFRKAEKGCFYPKLPAGLSEEQKGYAKEILETLTGEPDGVGKTVILDALHTLANILEDGYVDARYSHEFPGTPARGIALNNLRIAETAPDITEMIDRELYAHNIVLNLLIQYVNAGEINNLSGYKGEYLDRLAAFIPVVDDCLYDEDARSRCDAANRILIDLWPLVRECIDGLQAGKQQTRREPEQDGEQEQDPGQGGPGQGSPGQGTSGQGVSGQQYPGAEDAGEDRGIGAALSGQRPQTAPNFQIQSAACPSTGSYVPDRTRQQTVRTQISRVLSEETGRIAPHVTEEIGGADGDGQVTANTAYEGAGYAYAADDIERVLEEMGERLAGEKLEEELSEELQREADSISYGNAHRGVSVTVNRMPAVDQSLIDAYNTVAQPLLLLSKRLQRGVSAALRDKRQGGKQTGLMAGKRLNQHALHRDDGRIFYNTRLPTEPIDLAVALLIDESGSRSLSPAT